MQTRKHVIWLSLKEITRTFLGNSQFEIMDPVELFCQSLRGYADFDESSAEHRRHQQFHRNTWSDWDDWESADWDQDSRTWGHNTWAHSQGTFDVWNRGSLENPRHHEESGWVQSIHTNSHGWSEGAYQQDHEEEKFTWFSGRKGTEATPEVAAFEHQSFDDNAGRGCGSGEAFLGPDPPSTVHQSSSQTQSIYGQGVHSINPVPNHGVGLMAQYTEKSRCNWCYRSLSIWRATVLL